MMFGAGFHASFFKACIEMFHFSCQSGGDKIAALTHTSLRSQTDPSVRGNLGEVQAFLICQHRLGEPHSNRNGRSPQITAKTQQFNQLLKML